MVSAANLCLDRGHGKAVQGDKAGLEQPPEENKDRAVEGRRQLADQLDRVIGGLVPCPECKYLVVEWWQACPRCALKASEVSEKHMQRLREGRNDELLGT